MRTDTNIILIQKPGIKYSTVGFFITAGANQETDRTGVAHLLEHVMCANSTTLQLEAETQLEFMAFYTTQLAENTTKAIKALNEYLFSKDLKRENLTIQAQRIKLELQTVFQDATYQDVYGQLFGKNSSQYRGWSGSFEDISSITLSELLAFKDKTFSINNAVVAVAGDFNPAEVKSVISELHLEHGVEIKSPTHANITEEKMVWRTHTEGQIANIDIFIPSSPISDFETHAMDDLLFTCLVKGDDSLLGKFLYKELGSVYHIESEMLRWSNAGMLAFGFSSPVDQADETADKVYEMLTNLPKYLTEDVFERKRESLLLQLVVDENDPFGLVRRFGEELLLTGMMFTFEEYRATLNTMTYDNFLKRVEQVARLTLTLLKE